MEGLDSTFFSRVDVMFVVDSTPQALKDYETEFPEILVLGVRLSVYTTV